MKAYVKPIIVLAPLNGSPVDRQVLNVLSNNESPDAVYVTVYLPKVGIVSDTLTAAK